MLNFNDPVAQKDGTIKPLSEGSGGGGGGSEYSTDEKIIGTWIDGSPVYRKVFTNVNGTMSKTTGQWSIFDNVTFDNPLSFIIEGCLLYGDANYIIVPSAYSVFESKLRVMTSTDLPSDRIIKTVIITYIKPN